jgi:hypothetical protein
MSTTLVPQVLGKSCWAASLEMFTGRQLLQCDLLRTDYGPTVAPNFCDTAWQRANMGGYAGNAKTLQQMVDLLQPAGITHVLIEGEPELPSFARLRSDVGACGIILFSWSDAGDLHYIVPTKIIEQRLKASNVIQWIKILDPFPLVKGRTYYLNYKEFSFLNWFKGILS